MLESVRHFNGWRIEKIFKTARRKYLQELWQLIIFCCRILVNSSCLYNYSFNNSLEHLFVIFLSEFSNEETESRIYFIQEEAKKISKLLKTHLTLMIIITMTTGEVLKSVKNFNRWRIEKIFKTEGMKYLQELWWCFKVLW